MAGKESILAIERNGTDQIFNLVGVDLDAAIRQEGLQPLPVIVDIGELLTQPRLCRCLAALRQKLSVLVKGRFWSIFGHP